MCLCARACVCICDAFRNNWVYVKRKTHERARTHKQTETHKHTHTHTHTHQRDQGQIREAHLRHGRYQAPPPPLHLPSNTDGCRQCCKHRVVNTHCVVNTDGCRPCQLLVTHRFQGTISSRLVGGLKRHRGVDCSGRPSAWPCEA